MKIHSCDYEMALSIIDRDFGLGLRSKTIPEWGKMENIITWQRPKDIKISKPPTIQVVTKPFTKVELEYWQKYGIGEQDLIREGIFSPKQIWRNKSRLPLGNLLTFCYWYDTLQLWKIYRPLAPKRAKMTACNEWKWDSAIPFDYCDGLETITDCQFSFLTKSRKDKLVLKKALEIECVVDCQAEDPACIQESTILTLMENSKIQVTVFDNDKKGKESSWWLTNNYGFKHCNVPDKYNKEGITDFADLAEKYGLEAVREHFKEKGFLWK